MLSNKLDQSWGATFPLCNKSHCRKWLWKKVINTTTCFGHLGDHRHIVHTKVDKLIQYASTNILMSKFRTP